MNAAGKMATRAMVVTPHHLATQTAISILRQGGTAIEAMVGAAATASVVYPHNNSIGGDSFWLIIPPEGDPFTIEACGAAGSLATPKFFEGLDQMPEYGPKSANTVAGTVGGWQEALNYVTECGYTRLSLHSLLADAIKYAEDGFPVSENISLAFEECFDSDSGGEFKRVFYPDGKCLKIGEMLYQKRLASTLRSLVENGLNSFYKGEVAKLIATDASLLGMPITESDLTNYKPVKKPPLRMLLKQGEILNLQPPTQGLVSMAVLGILEKLGVDGKDEGEFIHKAVEATKQAFQMRDQYITDPALMKVHAESLLSNRSLTTMANNIDPLKASDVGTGKGPGDTIWMGISHKGFHVSFIQSVYHYFGSRVVLPRTGILWQNRGASFSLDPDHLLSIKPGKKPFHTLNAAAALLHDGRTLIYGTRGGDGQSQTQTAIFHKYVIQGMGLQESVTSPRWLFGRVVGDHDDNLKLEGRFGKETVEYLKRKGHDVVMLKSLSLDVGEAGMIVSHPNGVLEGAFDPRSDGSVAGF